MKRLFSISLFSLLSIIFVNTTNAQLVKIGVGGGTTIFQSPAMFTNNFSLVNGDVLAFGFKNAYHLGVEAKFNIPMLPITPVAFIDYHILKGSGSNDSLGFSTSMNIFTIGAEAEYSFIPLPFVHPYLLINITENNLGQVETQASNGASIVNIPSKSRIGAGAGIGAEVTIPPVNFDISLKYNTFNLVGKASGEQSINSLNLSLELLF